MAHVDLCSGLGGFALGFQWAELSSPALFCDIEPWSRKILRKHWPDVPIADDVKELANDPDGLVPDCDILTAGYPCQPFSIAGLQKGSLDDRHIWSHLHKIIAQKFNDLASGKIKRLIVNMPPRHTKSEFASYLFPAWMMGLRPNAKLMQVSHNAELSYRFGRKVRNLVNSEDFKRIFTSVSLQADSKAAGRWNTNKGGEYFAIGVGGAVTGKGADLLIIDDPHSEQEGASADINVFNLSLIHI